MLHDGVRDSSAKPPAAATSLAHTPGPTRATVLGATEDITLSRKLTN